MMIQNGTIRLVALAGLFALVPVAAVANPVPLVDRLPAWAAHLTTDARVDHDVLEMLVDGVSARVVILFRLQEDRSRGPLPELDETDRRELIRTIAADLLLRLSAGDFRLIHRYVAVRALAGEISLRGLDRLLEDPRIEGIGLDVGGSGHLGEALPLVNIDDLKSVHALSGDGVVVAVLDSGYESGHADLSDDLVGEQCYCGASCCPDGSIEQSGAGSAEDDHGHGTNVSGVITSKGTVAPQGGAPDADIVAIKVLAANNSFCCATDIIAGLDWIIANRPDVDLVNMSLGTFARFAGACDNAEWWTIAWAEAIDSLRSSGVLSFASSGNDRDKTLLPVPACIANTIAVGAVWDSNVGEVGIHECSEPTAADKVTCWSNSNSLVDVFAPGAPITSSGMGGGTSTFYGTSQASPLAAACGALLKEGEPALTADELEILLEGSTTMVTDAGNGLSFPRVDCLEAWEPCGHPLVEEFSGYTFAGTESVDACQRITVVGSTVAAKATTTLTSGRLIELGDGVNVSGDLTLALNPSWAINPSI